mmetsp:Transcript_5300/g.10139  ORF Transcript_5300/g.10139 Transcript_5300/m.10139 type:complete len:327 (-) Transcript_5300:381-1361(-)
MYSDSQLHGKSKEERMRKAAEYKDMAMELCRQQYRKDGDKDARYFLALGLFEGFSQNLFVAFELFEEGHQQGDVRATYWYGRALLDGLGTSKNVEEGIRLLQEAASNGSSQALFELGILFEYGDGFNGMYVRKNLRRAIACYEDVSESSLNFDVIPEFFKHDVARNIDWHETEDILTQTEGSLLSWELAGQAFLFSAAAILSGVEQPDHYAPLLILLPIIGIVLAAFSVVSSCKMVLQNSSRRKLPLEVYRAKQEAYMKLVKPLTIHNSWTNPIFISNLARLGECFLAGLSVLFLAALAVLLAAESVSRHHFCSNWWHSDCTSSST